MLTSYSSWRRSEKKQRREQKIIKKTDIDEYKIEHGKWQPQLSVVLIRMFLFYVSFINSPSIYGAYNSITNSRYLYCTQYLSWLEFSTIILIPKSASLLLSPPPPSLLSLYLQLSSECVCAKVSNKFFFIMPSKLLHYVRQSKRMSRSLSQLNILY